MGDTRGPGASRRRKHPCHLGSNHPRCCLRCEFPLKAQPSIYFHPLIFAPLTLRSSLCHSMGLELAWPRVHGRGSKRRRSRAANLRETAPDASASVRACTSLCGSITSPTPASFSSEKETQRLAGEQPHILAHPRTIVKPKSPGARAGLISPWGDCDVVCEEIGKNEADTIHICRSCPVGPPGLSLPSPPSPATMVWGSGLMVCRQSCETHLRQCQEALLPFRGRGM